MIFDLCSVSLSSFTGDADFGVSCDVCTSFFASPKRGLIIPGAIEVEDGLAPNEVPNDPNGLVF